MTNMPEMTINDDMKVLDKEGQEIKTTPVPITRSDSEQWIRIELEDGTILKFKAIILKVSRLEENTPLGEPQYVVESQNVAVVEKVGSSVK